MFGGREQDHDMALSPEPAHGGSLAGALAATLSAFWTSTGDAPDPRASALRRHLGQRFARGAGSTSSLFSAVTDLDRMFGHGRLTLLSSLAVAVVVMTLGLDLAYWLYAPEFDTAGQMDAPELMLLVALAVAGLVLVLQQTIQGRLQEQADERAISGAISARPDDVLALHAELAESRIELAQQRQRIAELEARGLGAPSGDDRLALLGHDLRTPLNAVIGFSDLMAQEVYGPLGHPKYREYARHVRESGRALLGVAQELINKRASAAAVPPTQAMPARRMPPIPAAFAPAAFGRSGVTGQRLPPAPDHATEPQPSSAGEVEEAITQSLAGLRRTAAHLSEGERRQGRPFGKRTAA